MRGNALKDNANLELNPELSLPPDLKKALGKDADYLEVSKGKDGVTEVRLKPEIFKDCKTEEEKAEKLASLYRKINEAEAEVRQKKADVKQEKDEASAQRRYDNAVSLKKPGLEGHLDTAVAKLELAMTKNDIKSVLEARQVLHTIHESSGITPLSPQAKRKLLDSIDVADGNWERAKAIAVIEANQKIDDGSLVNQNKGLQASYQERRAYRDEVRSLILSTPTRDLRNGALDFALSKLGENKSIRAWEGKFETELLSLGRSGWTTGIKDETGVAPTIGKERRVGSSAAYATDVALDLVNGQKSYDSTILFSRLEGSIVTTPGQYLRQRAVNASDQDVVALRAAALQSLIPALEPQAWVKTANPDVLKRYEGERKVIIEDAKELEKNAKSEAEIIKIRIKTAIDLQEHTYLFVKEERANGRLQLSAAGEVAIKNIEGMRSAAGDDRTRAINAFCDEVAEAAVMAAPGGGAAIAEKLVGSRLRGYFIRKFGEEALKKPAILAAVMLAESGALGYTFHTLSSTGKYALGNDKAFDNFMMEGAKTWMMFLGMKVAQQGFTKVYSKAVVNPAEFQANAERLLGKTQAEIREIATQAALKDKPMLRALFKTGSFATETYALAIQQMAAGVASGEIDLGPGGIEAWNKALTSSLQTVVALKIGNRVAKPITAQIGKATENLDNRDFNAKFPERPKTVLGLNEEALPLAEMPKGLPLKAQVAQLWENLMVFLGISKGSSGTAYDLKGYGIDLPTLQERLSKLTPGDPNSYEVIGARTGHGVTSNLVSGRHVTIWREADGTFTVRDGVPSTKQVLVQEVSGRAAGTYSEVDPKYGTRFVEPGSIIRIDGARYWIGHGLADLAPGQERKFSFGGHLTDSSTNVVATLRRAEDGHYYLTNGSHSTNGTKLIQSGRSLVLYGRGASAQSGDGVDLAGRVRFVLPGKPAQEFSNGFGDSWSQPEHLSNLRQAGQKQPSYGINVSGLYGQILTYSSHTEASHILEAVHSVRNPGLVFEGVSEIIVTDEIGRSAQGKPIRAKMDDQGILYIAREVANDRRELKRVISLFADQTKQIEEQNNARHDYTRIFVDNIRFENKLGPARPGAPYGTYESRPILGKGVRILGSVDYNASTSNKFKPAIVVDPVNDATLKSHYDSFRQRVRLGMSEAQVMQEIQKYILEVMPYYHPADKVDMAIWNHFNRQGIQLERGDKIQLGSLLNAKNNVGGQGIGVCRHQGLLAGAFAEMLQAEGFFAGGKISFDRNQIEGEGGHAWMRYESKDGRISIVDPAQEYVGPITTRGRDRWNYFRPEDVIAYRERPIY